MLNIKLIWSWNMSGRFVQRVHPEVESHTHTPLREFSLQCTLPLHGPVNKYLNVNPPSRMNIAAKYETDVVVFVE